MGEKFTATCCSIERVFPFVNNVSQFLPKHKMLTPKTVINLAKVTTCNKNHMLCCTFLDPAAWCGMWHGADWFAVRAVPAPSALFLSLCPSLSVSVCLHVCFMRVGEIYLSFDAAVASAAAASAAAFMQHMPHAEEAQTTQQKEAEDTGKKGESKKLAG